LSWLGTCLIYDEKTVKSVTLTAHDGETQITFRPTDIKALASLLWASNTYHSKFVGGRCNDKEPETDENGRIQSQECFDNNPGAWHIAVTNEIGANKNTFVMDATYDYEVWNHPISSYSTSYFNPVTMDFSGLKESIVAIKDFNNDKFKSYRDERTKYVVGVTMSVRYLVETNPSLATSDEPYHDGYHTAYYEYDLELDENYNIIGGEWYSNKHPDFLWTPSTSKVYSIVDQYAPNAVTLKTLSDPTIKSIIPYASEGNSPVASLVEEIIDEASK
jgi:hypothetical protein